MLLQCVHDLYAPGGAAVAPVGAAFPGVVVDGGVNRDALSQHVVGAGKEAAMKRLEGIVHPLVSDARSRFLRDAAARGEPLAVLDVPLLYETGLDAACDAVAVVSTCDAEAQRSRVLSRPGMSASKLDGILARQLPDEEKRRRAAFIIDTACTLEQTYEAVARLVLELRGRHDTRAA